MSIDTTGYTQSNPAPAPGGVAYQGISQGQDSLTQFIRSIGNAEGYQGSTAFGQGQQQFGAGQSAAAAPMDFFTKLLNGGADAEGVMAPQMDAITQQFDKIRQMVMTNPRGGGQASALMTAPYEEIKAKADTMAKARTEAAGAAGQLATAQEGLGIQEMGLGAQAMSAAGNLGLSKDTLNLQENASWMQMLGQFGEAAGTVLAGI